MLLIIDNYDSFTYNLVQYFQCLDQEVVVYYHDQLSIQQLAALKPDHLVISPGPKAPNDAGISLAAIDYFHQKIPILGICLGHQCIAQYFGACIMGAPQIMHGKTSVIEHDGQGIFDKVPNYFQATRYHSLAVNPKMFPSVLTIDAWAKDTIMAISHRHYPIYGLQFHPEAILSQHGLLLLKNFLHHRTLM